MRHFQRALFIAAFAVIGVIGLQQSAAAEFEVSISSGDMQELSLGQSFPVYLSIQPDDDGKTYWAGGFFSVGGQAQFVPTDRFDHDSPGYLAIYFTVNQDIYDACATAGQVEYHNTGRVFEEEGSGQPVLWMNDEGTLPCSAGVPSLSSVAVYPPTLVEEVCGPNNDVYNPTNPDPMNGATVESFTDWENNQRTITYVPADGFEFTTDSSFTVTDQDTSCDTPVTISAPTLANAICGPNNDEFSLDMPEGVSGDWVSGWANNSRTVEYTAETGYEIQGDASFTVTDSNIPCVSPVPPTVAEVCGPENDVVSVPEQPTGVTVSTSDGWENDTYIVEFSAAEGYAFPAGVIARVEVTDQNFPCPEGVPVPPVQIAICGPDNDEVIIPDQPEGVIVESSGTWADGEWTVSFSAAEGFVLPNEAQTLYELVDENTECPVPTQEVTINVVMPDTGTAEGGTWQLFAPMASQTTMQPYAEGVVSADNTILLAEITAGEYRLTVNVSGYQPLDTTITIEQTTTELSVHIAALQEEATTTPTPPEDSGDVTPAPTSSANDESSEDDAEAVTSLPQTGTGSGTGVSIAALGIAASMLLVTWTAFNRRNSAR